MCWLTQLNMASFVSWCISNTMAIDVFIVIISSRAVSLWPHVLHYSKASMVIIHLTPGGMLLSIGAKLAAKPCSNALLTLQDRYLRYYSQIAKFMGPTWGPPGSYRPLMGPMLAPWTLLSGNLCIVQVEIGRGRRFAELVVRGHCWLQLAAVCHLPTWSYRSRLVMQGQNWRK